MNETRMLYIERMPAAPLRQFVRSLWYSNTPSAPHARERILPSGCAQIVVALSREFLTDCSENGSDRRSAPGLLVGQRSRSEIIHTSNLADLAGVLFRPGGLPAFLADRADLLSNESVPLDQIWCGLTDRLRCRMQEGASPEHRLLILEDCLATLLLRTRANVAFTVHPAVEFALEQFAAASKRVSKRVSIADIARRAGWGERRLSQVFREQVGFPPKVWLRLQRFQSAIRQLRAGSEVPWSELALECGFYDQAHLANEFRSFSGLDLTTYTAMRHELWANHVRTA